MQHLYIIGDGVSEGDVGGQPLDYTQKSPVRYQVSGTELAYTVFSVPQYANTEFWEYNGEAPLQNLGFMPAFASDAAGGEIVYARFNNTYLPGYLVSAIMLLLLAVGYCWHRRLKN